MQQSTFYLNLSTAQHISGGTSPIIKRSLTLYLQYLALMRPVLQPVVNVAGLACHVHGLVRQYGTTRLSQDENSPYITLWIFQNTCP